MIAAAKRRAVALDPGSAVRRAAKAESERYVSCRPAPDTRVWVTGLLPVTQGVAVHAALTRHADTLRARGDARGRGQIMADTLVERVTGQAAAADVDRQMQPVMTDRTLFAGDSEPAWLEGYGTLPGEWAAPGSTPNSPAGGASVATARQPRPARPAVPAPGSWWGWIRGPGCSRPGCAGCW